MVRYEVKARIRGKWKIVKVIGKGSNNPNSIAYFYWKVKDSNGKTYIISPNQLRYKRRK